MPLGKRADFGDARYAGAEVDFTCDIIDTLQVCAPLFVQRNSFSHWQQGVPPSFPNLVLGLLTVTQLQSTIKAASWVHQCPEPVLFCSKSS